MYPMEKKRLSKLQGCAKKSYIAKLQASGVNISKPATAPEPQFLEGGKKLDFPRKESPYALRGKVYCLCRRPDYGTPIVGCEACGEWFHVECLGLNLKQAEHMQVFYCTTCDLEAQLADG